MQIWHLPQGPFIVVLWLNLLHLAQKKYFWFKDILTPKKLKEENEVESKRWQLYLIRKTSKRVNGKNIYNKQIKKWVWSSVLSVIIMNEHV